MTTGLGKKNLPRVFDYIDYRHFLAYTYRAKKKEDPKFSFRYLSRKAGVASPSYFKDVIDGMNVAPDRIDGICRALGLGKKERGYFENLVLFNQATSPESKKFYYDKILPIYKRECGAKIASHQYEYFTLWYAPVIREMIQLAHFDPNPVWISKKLKRLISPTQATQALELLLKLGLAVKDDSGKYYQTDAVISTPAEVEEVSLFKYHHEMLDMAKNCLKTDDGFKREFAGIVAALSPAQFEDFKKEIQDFQSHLAYRFGVTKGDATNVYQFSCQLFSLTKMKEESHVQKDA